MLVDQKTLPVSVLIPTMNRADSLKYTINSYASANYIPKEIIVVDQTPDESVRNEISGFLSTFKEIDIKYIYQSEPSTTISRNTAARTATQPILIYSDDDVEVNSETLYKLYKRFEEESIALIFVLSADVAYKRRSVSSEFFEIISNGVSFFKRKKGHITASLLGSFPSKLNGEADTEWAMGYFFAVRKELTDRWNIVWDNNLSGYGYAEDLDFSMNYCNHAQEEGMRCIVSSDIYVKHLYTSANRIATRKLVCVYVINRLYLSYKHKLGIFSRFAIHWRNWIMGILLSIKRKWKLRDVIYAYGLYFKHKDAVKNGKLAEIYHTIYSEERI